MLYLKKKTLRKGETKDLKIMYQLDGIFENIFLIEAPFVN